MERGYDEHQGVHRHVSIPLRGFRCGKKNYENYPFANKCFNPLARIPMWKVERSVMYERNYCFNPLARIPMWKARKFLGEKRSEAFQSPCEDSDVERLDPGKDDVGEVSIPLRGFRCGKWSFVMMIWCKSFQSPCEDSDVERRSGRRRRRPSRFQSPCEDSDVESWLCPSSGADHQFQSPCEDSDVERSGNGSRKRFLWRVSIPLRGFRCGKLKGEVKMFVKKGFNPLARIPMWKAGSRRW